MNHLQQLQQEGSELCSQLHSVIPTYWQQRMMLRLQMWFLSFGSLQEVCYNHSSKQICDSLGLRVWVEQHSTFCWCLLWWLDGEHEIVNQGRMYSWSNHQDVVQRDSGVRFPEASKTTRTLVVELVSFLTAYMHGHVKHLFRRFLQVCDRHFFCMFEGEVLFHYLQEFTELSLGMKRSLQV